MTELWYSAVIRSNWLHGDETARELSPKVADWRRSSLWSTYDLFTNRLNAVVVLGWPPAMRESGICVPWMMKRHTNTATSNNPPCILC